MATLPTVIHQPTESRLVSMEFAALLASGETLSAVSSVTADKTTIPALTIGTPAVSGTKATFRISGGDAGTLYKVTALVTTSAGNTLEGEGNIQCEDL